MDENTTYDDLIMRFGKPQLLADSFIEEYDENILRKKIKQKKILLVICVMTIFVLCVIFALSVSDYFTAHDSYITREQEVINEN